jgi:D-alanyl-D-alanine carboxypeptidase/D-alanyl-D-alanine-endopeptidase (penicillin-binding protein 4)
MTYTKLKDIAKKLNAPANTPIYVRQGYRAGVPPTWEHDDLPNRYAPRITAFTVDRGSFTLASENGAPKLVPESYGVRIMQFPGGEVRTDFDPFGNLMIVHGDVPKENRNLENFAIPEPDRAAASILGGRLFEATSLPERSPDLVIEGDSIGEMAKACLPPSDNYLAEGLMLLAASKEGDLSDAPYTKGPARMREFLVKTVGLSTNDVRPYDGSGMSRHNFVTPLGIAKVLAWARKQAWGGLWVDAMAHPGKPGTLSSRLAGSSFVGKTGSLNSVASLSGYVKAGNGDPLIVVTIFNHFISPPAEVRAVADSVVKELEKPVTLASILVPRGLLLEGTIRHESDRSQPRNPAADGDRLFGPLYDRLASFPGPDRRAQPSHAAAHRAERMAFRLR